MEKWAREAREEGAEAVILDRSKAVEGLKGKKGPLFVVLSRERAKLGPGWERALAWRTVPAKGKGERVPACPSCGALLTEEEAERAEKRRLSCPRCKSPLWQEVPPRREAVYHALKRLLPKGFFDLLILDEAHEYKGGNTAQGLTAAGLMDWVGQTLLLTGTLFGGYARDIYPTLARSVPEVRERWPKEGDFAAQFGLLERVERQKVVQDGYYTRRRETRGTTRERPGLSPLLLPLLLPRAAFVRLGEVAEALPPYREEIRIIPMDEVHSQVYRRFQENLRKVVARALAEGSRALLGHLLMAGLQTPDSPWLEEEILTPFGTVRMPALEETHRHEKEKVLLELVRDEVGRGRRVLVYVQGTDRRDQIARLVDLLRQEGIQADGLRAEKVDPAKREAWIRERVGKGLQALVLHPRLVQTGLDLVDFPTLVFYQPEYSVYTLRQASRRSWRIGQPHPVRVVFLAYRGTLQESALTLVARKARASLALEGELPEGGLIAAAEEDPTLALARALVQGVERPEGLEGSGPVLFAPRGVPVKEIPRWPKAARGG